MPSLRQLLTGHASLLVLDAAASRVQAGWLKDGTARWETSAEEAGLGIFQCIETLGVEVAEIAGFVFCEGPGSVLGIRTVAMALRTWNVLRPRPVFAYSSLALVAHAIGRADLGVIVDARRDSWHHYQLGTGLRRTAAKDLAGELVMPEHFRHWAPLPPHVAQVPYAVADLLSRAADADLFCPSDAPDAFLHEEPNYLEWTPQIHRAPNPR